MDRRPFGAAPPGVTTWTVDLRKRAAEDVFRKFRPEVVVHMATVTSLVVQGEERHRINLGGTRAVFEHSSTYGVKHVVFLGRHTYYGATPDSPLYHTEDEPPFGLSLFPELADLVAADLYAAGSLWRHPEVATTVMRLCYTLGPSRQGTLAAFVRPHRVPMVFGFDPLFQFMDETDAVRAIMAAVHARPKGVFNVTGPAPLPLSSIVHALQKKVLWLPEPILVRLLGRFGLPAIPRGAVEHIKHPVVADGSRFAKATGFAHRFSEVETVERYRLLRS